MNRTKLKSFSSAKTREELAVLFEALVEDLHVIKTEVAAYAILHSLMELSKTLGPLNLQTDNRLTLIVAAIREDANLDNTKELAQQLIDFHLTPKEQGRPLKDLDGKTFMELIASDDAAEAFLSFVEKSNPELARQLREDKNED